MISNKDNLVIADLTEKKLLEVNHFTDSLKVKADVIGGWTENKTEKDVLSEKNNMQIFNNSLEFFTNYKTQNNPITIIFINHIDECEREIKKIISYKDIHVKSIIIASISTTYYKIALIKKLCQKINTEVNFISLNTERAYKLLKAEEIAWNYNDLDITVKNELKERRIKSGRFLDVGAGLCTQSYKLAKMGFEVIAMDISDEAIELAQSNIQDVKIEYLVGDVLEMNLNEEVDYILDRGCFHCIHEMEDRFKYTKTIWKALKPNGILFLKVFNKKCSVNGEFELFNKMDIIDLFSEGFKIEKIKDSFITDNTGHDNKAIYAVIRCIK